MNFVIVCLKFVFHLVILTAQHTYKTKRLWEGDIGLILHILFVRVSHSFVSGHVNFFFFFFISTKCNFDSR